MVKAPAGFANPLVEIAMKMTNVAQEFALTARALQPVFLMAANAMNYLTVATLTAIQ
jgi:hypothetical protein